MSLTSRLFCFSLFVAISTTSIANSSAQEIEPKRLIAAGDETPAGLSIIYDADSGRVTGTAPDTADLTALQLLSEGSLFTETCQNVNGAFDVCDPDEVFKLETDGFTTVDFGPILQSNLDGESLLKDLWVNGASVGGGFDVGDGPFLVVIPEPASGLMLACGLCLLVISRRRRS